MKRLMLILVPLVILGALIAWRTGQKRADQMAQAQQADSRKKAAPVVQLAPVITHAVVRTFLATGSIDAPLSVKLAPKVTGPITYLTVHEGDRVTKGQVLVRIDPATINAQVEQKRATLAEAQYRLTQAQLTQAPTNSMVTTQIHQQQAAVSSAQANYNQVQQNYAAQVSAAEAAVTDAQGRVENANASIGSAKAAINSAKANFENASTKLNRLQELYAKGFIAAQDVDDAKATVAVEQANQEMAQGQLKAAQAGRDSALAQQHAAEQQAAIVKTKGKADIEAARAALKQAEAALEYARANTAQTPAYQQNLAALRAEVEAARADLHNSQAQMSDTVLICPLDGFVTGRYMDPGGLASPSQPIIGVQFIKQVWVTFAVPEEVSSKLHQGESVQVIVDSFPNHPYSASISQINPSADVTSRQYTIRAVIDNPTAQLKPGMYAHITVTTDRLDNAIVVPLEAIQTDKDGAYVVTVSKTGETTDPSGKTIPTLTTHIARVVPGLSDAKYSAILSGVNVGDRVVTMCALPLKDDMHVRIEGGGKGHGKGAASGDATGAAGANGADGVNAASSADAASSGQAPSGKKHGHGGHGKPGAPDAAKSAGQ